MNGIPDAHNVHRFHGRVYVHDQHHRLQRLEFHSDQIFLLIVTMTRILSKTCERQEMTYHKSEVR